MSSVVIAGDTSGTVTLAAPAVSGTTTLTLPATTSTLSINGPAFSAYLSGNQTVTTSVATKLAFNTEEFDTNSNFDSTTNYRFTPTVAGYYQVVGSIYPSTLITTIQAYIYKNGAAFKIGDNLASAGQTSASVSALIYMNGSTDYLELYGYLVGTTPSVLGGNSTPVTWFSAAMIRSA